MAEAPKNVRAHREDAVLEIVWQEGGEDRIPFRLLRAECPCAVCVDELTGIRTLDVDSIPQDIHPTEIGLTGNYALNVQWSDGHSTGYFTWENLERIGRLASEGGGKPDIS